MPQTTQNKSGLMFPNSVGPRWNYKYPNGNASNFLLHVTGSGFGTKPQQTPAIWETFKTATPGQLVNAYDPLWVPYQGNGAIITDQNARLPGLKSAYNDPTRGEFWTNYKSFTPSPTVFLSYYARTVGFRVGLDNGVLKWGRINSSTAAGGGGNYNGEGAVTVQSAGDFPGGYGSWSGSENLGNLLGYFNDSFPVNQWFRIEYESQLNDVDVANGFVNFNRDGISGLASGNLMQRKTGFTKANYLNDSTLLGVEAVNARQYFTPIVLTANTTYTVTVNGTPCTWTSGGATPTEAEVVVGIRDAVIASGVTTFVTTTATEIYIDYGKTSVYDAKFLRTSVFGMQVSELYVDTTLSRFVVGNSATYDACTEKNIQPYISWSDNSVYLEKNYGNIVGTKHLYFVSFTGNVRNVSYRGVVT